MTTQPLEPHPDLATYRAEVRAALTHPPERATQLAELERQSGAATSLDEARALSAQIGELLGEACDEIDATRRAAGKPVPWRSGQPRPE